MRHIFIVCLIVTIVSGGLFLKPRESHAILDSFGADLVAVIGGTGTIQDTISAAANTITSGVQQALQIKEFALDDIAFKLAKKVLADSTANLVEWINTGFEGKPAFITNLNDYLLNAADEAMGSFIAESNFAAVCQPMRVPLRIIINNHYLKARDWQKESECTISGAAGNLEDFYNGNITEGGWRDWFEIVSEPQNNIYGLAAMGISRADNVVAGAVKNSERESDWSNGWLSVKDCSAGKCITVTPGNVISEYLNFKLTVGDRTLIEADEINEVFGALFNQLGNQAIAGVGGLLGLSYSADGTTPAYLDQYRNESAQAGSGVINSSFLDDAIRIETQYLAMYEKALEDIEELETTFESCATPGNSDEQEKLQDLLTEYQLEVDTTAGILALLSLLKDEFMNNPDLQLKQALVQQFLELKSEGIFHEAADVELRKQSIAGEVVELQSKSEQCTE